MQLMNIRYKVIEDFIKEDFPIMMVDWVRNTSDLRYRMDFDEEEFTGHQIYKDGQKELTIVEYGEVGAIAALCRDKDVLGVEWELSVVFKPSTHELFIRMTNSKTTEDGKFMINFRKPDLIDELVDLRILDMDYDVPMMYESHTVKKNGTAEFLSVLNRNARFTLPVIYVSVGPYSMYGADPEKLASIYAGMAHVFAQDHRDCFEELINGTDKLVPKNGEVAIYYPNENIREAHFPFNKYDEASMEKAISKAIHFFYHNQSFGPLTTYEEIAARAIAIRNSNLKMENNEINLENLRVKNENNEIVEAFDEDLKKSDEELARLKKRLQELETENEILRRRVETIDKEPILFYGAEKELYVGEIKEILTDVLANNVIVPEGSRREHVIKDLIAANIVEPTIRDRHEKVKKTLSNYRDMTPEIRRALEEIGFDITSDGKHHKLIYRGDARYQISISKTSSDFRSGMNAAAYITKNMM